MSCTKINKYKSKGEAVLWEQHPFHQEFGVVGKERMGSCQWLQSVFLFSALTQLVE